MNLLEQCGLKKEYFSPNKASCCEFYRRERPPGIISRFTKRSCSRRGSWDWPARRSCAGRWALARTAVADGQNIAALDGFADGDRDCGYRGKATTPAAA